MNLLRVLSRNGAARKSNRHAGHALVAPQRAADCGSGLAALGRLPAHRTTDEKASNSSETIASARKSESRSQDFQQNPFKAIFERINDLGMQPALGTNRKSFFCRTEPTLSTGGEV